MLDNNTLCREKSGLETGALCWEMKAENFQITFFMSKHKLKMAGKDGFFRVEVLDLLFEEENNEVLDEIFNPFFMEATVEVSRSLFCIKFMKRDVCKCNQISYLP